RLANLRRADSSFESCLGGGSEPPHARTELQRGQSMQDRGQNDLLPARSIAVRGAETGPCVLQRPLATHPLQTGIKVDVHGLPRVVEGIAGVVESNRNGDPYTAKRVDQRRKGVDIDDRPSINALAGQ